MKCRQQARTSVSVHCIHAGYCHAAVNVHTQGTPCIQPQLHYLLYLYTISLSHSSHLTHYHLSPFTLHPHSSSLTLIPHLSPSSLTITLIPHPHPHPTPFLSLLCTAVLPSLTMRCSRIDLLVLDGSGLLLHDGTVLAIEGKPLRIGCYCGSVHQLPYRRT